MIVVRAKQGDTVSRLLLRELGRNDDDIEEALHQANPDLASFGPVLSEGLAIHLPEFAEPEPKKVVNVWD